MKKILVSILIGVMFISSITVSARVDFSTYIESLGMTVDEVLVEAFELKEQYFSTDDLGEKERIFTQLKLLSEATSKAAHTSLGDYFDVRDDYEKILKVQETGNKYINDDLETIRLKLRGYSAKATGIAGMVVDGTFQQETITEADKADIIALLDASILNGSIKKGGSEHFASGENVAISMFSVAVDALYNTIKGQEGYEDVIAKIKEVQNILNSDNSNTKAEEITNNINNSSVVFIDVKKTDWYYSQVMAMTEKGLFVGKGNNLFCPNDTMTRAEFIAVVVRTLYSDVDLTLKRDQAWWEPVYEVATDKGLITESEFPISSIEQTIPRQEMAVISVRALYALGETDIEEYKYVPDLHIANILYRDDVSKAYGAGIIVGDETGKFNPENTLTRAEASTVLYRIIEKSARAEVKFDLSAPITIYEGQYRTNRNAKEGDTFVKADGTQIILKKGPNGILGEGQGVAPDVGLNLGLYTVQADGGEFSYNAEKHGKMVDSTGQSIQNQRYSVHTVTGEGHWGHEWTAIGKAYPKPTYDGTYNGETSKDAYQLWVWMDGMWVKNLS